MMLVGQASELGNKILAKPPAVEWAADVRVTVALHGKDASTASEFASTGGCRFLIICV